MKSAVKMKQDLRVQARDKAKTEKQIDKQIESGIEEYRKWVSDEFREGNTPLTIIAEGDSWFNYSIAGSDVIDNLEKMCFLFTILKLKIFFLNKIEMLNIHFIT